MLFFCFGFFSFAFLLMYCIFLSQFQLIFFCFHSLYSLFQCYTAIILNLETFFPYTCRVFFLFFPYYCCTCFDDLFVCFFVYLVIIHFDRIHAARSFIFSRSIDLIKHSLLAFVPVHSSKKFKLNSLLVCFLPFSFYKTLILML